jgi:hypothetical protein
VNRKATLGNPEYVGVSQRSHGIGSDDLKSQKVATKRLSAIWTKMKWLSHKQIQMFSTDEKEYHHPLSHLGHSRI